MNKVNLLFVVKDFYQAGAQRFMYEVDAVIDRSKYDITILDFNGIRDDINSCMG